MQGPQAGSLPVCDEIMQTLWVRKEERYQLPKPAATPQSNLLSQLSSIRQNLQQPDVSSLSPCGHQGMECREGQPRACHSGHPNQATPAPARVNVVFPTPCTYSNPLPFLTPLPEPPGWALPSLPTPSPHCREGWL